FQLAIFIVDLNYSMKEIIIEIVRMVSCTYNPSLTFSTQDRGEITNLLEDLLSAFLGVCIVRNNNVVEDCNVTVKTDDIGSQACCEDRRISNDLFLTERVVYRDLRLCPLLSLVLVG